MKKQFETCGPELVHNPHQQVSQSVQLPSSYEIGNMQAMQYAHQNSNEHSPIYYQQTGL